MGFVIAGKMLIIGNVFPGKAFSTLIDPVLGFDFLL